MKKLFCGILAGGGGKRLWPLSNKKCPKQLIPFLENRSLLEQTINRFLLFDVFKKNLFVVTKQDQVQMIKNVAGKNIDFLIEEPTGRDTAPAILLSCLHLANKGYSNAVVVFVPADHFVPSDARFVSTMSRAIDYVTQRDCIATLGVMPTYPATGYGYIQAAVEEGENIVVGNCYNVKTFHEKPPLEQAECYIKRKDIFWNTGMFVAKVGTFLEEFGKYVPVLVEEVASYVAGYKDYADVQKISIDHAIMEKSKRLVVMPVDFEWYDVGNINVFLQLQHKYGKGSNQRLVQLDACNNLAKTSKRVVACVGVSNLCIVETEEALLIVARDCAEDVKTIVADCEQEA